MGRFTSKISLALIACLLFTGCSASSKSSSSESPSVPEEVGDASTQVSGVVLVPASQLSERITLSSSDAEVPLDGATVKAIDPLTGKVFTEVPATTTDSEGKFSLNLSAVASTNIVVRFVVTDEASDEEIIMLTRDEDESALTNKPITISQASTLVTNTIEKTKVLTVANLLESATDIPSDKKLTLEDAYRALLSAAKRLDVTAASSAPTLRVRKPSSNASSLTDVEIQKALAEQSIRNKTLIDTTIESDSTLGSAVNSAKTTYEVASLSIAKTLTYPEDMELIDLGETLEDPIELPAITFPEGTAFSRSVALSSETTALPTRAKIKAGFSLPADGSVTLGTATQFKRGASVPSAYAKTLPTSVAIEKDVDLPAGTKLPQGTTFEDAFTLKADRNFEYAMGFVLPKNVYFEDGFVMPKGTVVSYEDGFVIPSNVTLPTDMVIPKEVRDLEGREVDDAIANMFASDFVIKNDLKDNFSTSFKITSTVSDKFASDFEVDSSIVEKFDTALTIKQSLLDKFDEGVTLSEAVVAKLDADAKIKAQHIRKLERINAEIAAKFDTGVTIPNEVRERVLEVTSDIADKLGEDFVIDGATLEKFDDSISINQSLFDKFDDDVTISETIVTKLAASTKIKSRHLRQLEEIDSDIVERFDAGVKIPNELKSKVTQINRDIASRFDTDFKIDNSLKSKIVEIDDTVREFLDDEFTIDTDTLEKVVSIDSDIVARLDDGVEIDETMKDKIEEITPEVAQRFKDGFKIDNSLRSKIREIDRDMRSKFDDELELNEELAALLPEGEESDFNDYLPDELKYISEDLVFNQIRSNTLTEATFMSYYNSGKNLQAKTDDGDTFLAVAVKHGHSEMTSLLAELKGSISGLTFNLTEPNLLGISVLDFLLNPALTPGRLFETSSEVSIRDHYADIITPLVEEGLLDSSTREFTTDLVENSNDLESALVTHGKGSLYRRSIALLRQRKNVNIDTVINMVEDVSVFISDDMEESSYESWLGEITVHEKSLRNRSRYDQVIALRTNMIGLGY